MISVNLQRDIFNNTKTIIDDHLKKEKEKLSKEYVGKHICIKKLCAEKFDGDVSGFCHNTVPQASILLFS